MNPDGRSRALTGRAAAAGPALTAGGLAAVLYLRTLAPGLTWAHSGADGGDLLAAALTRGVPHPPGYPVYELLLTAAMALHPAGDPARTGNLCSAFAAAVAVALLADLARRSLAGRRGGALVALVAALAWAASPALWGQAVITEVYALNALAVLLVSWLLWQWRAAASSAPGAQAVPVAQQAGCYLAAAGLALGLGLGNHLSLALLLPAAATWVWSNRRLLAATPRWTGPAAALGLMAGLAVYLYLPWAATGNPPVNWGAPRSAGQLAWLVTAAPYRSLVFGLPPGRVLGRLAAWAGEAWQQFRPWGLAAAAFGLWRLDRLDHTWWRYSGLAALAFSIYGLGYNTADSYVYLIPAWAMAGLWLAVGLAELGDRAGAAFSRFGKVRPAGVALGLLLAFLLLPAASVAASFTTMDLSGDREARDFVTAVLARAGPDAVILVATDRPTFALWYAVYGLRQRPDLVPLNVNLYAYSWYRQTLATHHPALQAADIAEAPDPATLVARLARHGLVYRAEPLPIAMPGLQERPAGPLVQLVVP